MLTPSTRSPGESVLTIAASSPPEPARRDHRHVRGRAEERLHARRGSGPSIAANSGPRWLIIWRAPASRTEGGRAVGPGMRRLGSKRSTGRSSGAAAAGSDAGLGMALDGRTAQPRWCHERRPQARARVGPAALDGTFSASGGHLRPTAASHRGVVERPEARAPRPWSDPSVTRPRLVPAAIDSAASSSACVLLAVVGGTLGTFLVATDTFGAGERWQSVLNRVDRFLAGPVPDRPTVGTVRVTEPPATPPPTPPPTLAPGADAHADARSDPDPDAAAAAGRGRRQHRRRTPSRSSRASSTRTGAPRPASRWSSPCSGKVDTSAATQREIAGRVREWESYADSHNGDWGPAAMALALQGLRGARLRDPRLRDPQRGPARRGGRDPGDRLAGHAARLARRPHVGDDRVPRRRRPARLPEREDGGRLHPRPVVPAGVVDLGTVRSGRDVPGRRRDAAQLPAVEAPRGPLPGPRRAVHHARPDDLALGGAPS